MAQLIKCIECGGSISSDAKRCPHCMTQYPKGEKCRVCTKIVRTSEGKISYRGIQFMHAACFDKIFQPYSCQTCNNLTTIDYASYSINACNKCGQPIEFEECGYCEEYIVKNLAIHVKGDSEFVNRNSGDLIVHKACAASRHQSSCFIATAALDSPLAPEIKILQSFRDNVLKKHYSGRIFIALYESASPSLAYIIARNDVLRYLTRFLIIRPATWLARRAG